MLHIYKDNRTKKRTIKIKYIFHFVFNTYASVITIKSNQFHGSRKNVCFSRINPRATHFINASNV
jgi:hypothetical protein